MKKEILAFRRGDLFGKKKIKYFTGFQQIDPSRCFEIEDRIKDEGIFLPRDQLENKPEYKQIITYCVLFNTDENKIFSYKRAGSEKRLEGQWSMGLGGHVHGTENKDSQHVIRANMMNNLNKETNAVRYLEALHLIGYINYDENPVSRDHFGMLYVGSVYDIESIKTTSPKILRGKFRSIPEIEMIRRGEIDRFMNKKDRDKNKGLHGFEDWSEIAYRALKKRDFKLD